MLQGDACASGVGALGLPWIEGIAVQAVLAIFLLLLLAAFSLFVAFLAAVAHGKKILAEISVRDDAHCGAGIGFLREV